MSAPAKVDDIGEEDNLLTTKIRLTRNEYNATIRNKLEYNRLQVLTRYLEDENALKACKTRTSMHELRKNHTDNQQVVCSVDEFMSNRPVKGRSSSSFVHFSSFVLQALSGNSHYRPRVHSSFARLTSDRPSSRAKSASTLARPFTAPLRTVHEQDTESDDEIQPISMSRSTSAKRSIHRPGSVVSSSTLSHHPPAPAPSSMSEPAPALGEQRGDSSSNSHKITWPVSLKVFALQDENVARQQLLAWRAEQRKLRARRSSKSFIDVELERKHQESIRRQKELDAYLTPELIAEHKENDPIFAKRYRQLKLAIRSGKLPAYDPNDRHFHAPLSKSRIERARSALLSASQSKRQTIYRERQNHHDYALNKRIEIFLAELERFQKE